MFCLLKEIDFELGLDEGDGKLNIDSLHKYYQNWVKSKPFGKDFNWLLNIDMGITTGTALRFKNLVKEVFNAVAVGNRKS